MIKTYGVPPSVIDLGAAGHAGEDVLFTDLHEGYAVLQRQNEPVHPIFGVPVEDRAFRIEGAELEGRLDAGKKSE